MAYYDVAISKFFSNNKLFTYKFDKKLKNGTVVIVPYGRRHAVGIVIKSTGKPVFPSKSISQTTDIILQSSSLALIEWMNSFYPDDLGLMIDMFLPEKLYLDEVSDRQTKDPKTPDVLPTPTLDQHRALKEILRPEIRKILLHGDTGSGKTRVYLEKAIRTIDNGKNVIILTPEIGLTPQLFKYASKYADCPVHLYHSDLTKKQKLQVWQKAYNNEKPSIYLGPRSLLFLPLHNVGLIVVDEAHDNSYKQVNTPRYNAMHLASQLAKIHNSTLIFSTATPNVDDYYNQKKIGYKIIRMKQSATGDKSSKITVVNINNRDNFSINPYISDQLIKLIGEALQKNEQSLLFLNRRGSARLVKCNDCGWQADCPNCGIPLIYHHDINIIRCHGCNFKLKAPHSCPKCGSINIEYKFLGTKSLLDNVSKIFPNAKLIRLDTDTKSVDKLKNSYEQIRKGEADIIIGTQMISKGLDLPKLSVVGIINADSSLNMPDYRAEEITFQQLYQAIGRARRGHKDSSCVIQTQNPKHQVIKYVMTNDWEYFYDYEILKRKKYNYPPFCFMAIIKSAAKTNITAQKNIYRASKILAKCEGVAILGPSISFFEKRSGKYYWQLVLKSRSRQKLVIAIKTLPNNYIVDIDPNSLL